MTPVLTPIILFISESTLVLRTTQMSDCPHKHIQDSGLQAFREIIREETDGGRTIVEFLNGAAEGSLPDFEPQHRLQASEILANYGFKEASGLVRQHGESKPRRSSSNGSRSAPGAPALKKPEDRDPATDDLSKPRATIES